MKTNFSSLAWIIIVFTAAVAASTLLTKKAEMELADCQTQLEMCLAEFRVFQKMNP